MKHFFSAKFFILLHHLGVNHVPYNEKGVNNFNNSSVFTTLFDQLRTRTGVDAYTRIFNQPCPHNIKVF